MSPTYFVCRPISYCIVEDPCTWGQGILHMGLQYISVYSSPGIRECVHVVFKGHDHGWL